MGAREGAIRVGALLVAAAVMVAVAWFLIPKRASSPVEGGADRSLEDRVQALDRAATEGGWSSRVAPQLREIEERGEAGEADWIELLRRGSDLRLRRIAAGQLARVGGNAAIEPLRDAALLDADDRVRLAAFDALGSIRAVEALEEILQSTQEVEARRRAARNLARASSAEETDRLIDLFLVEADDGVLRTLAEALARVGGQEAAVRIGSSLEEGKLDRFGRLRALEALTRLGRPVPIDLVVAEIQRGPAVVRYAAIDCLAAVGGADAYPHLRGLLEGSSDLEVRARALWALSRVGAGSGLEVLERIARDGSEVVALRVAALDALAEAGGDAYRDLYQDLASKAVSPEVRRAAGRQLRR